MGLGAGRAVAGTEGGEAFLEGFITDITEQKETEIRFSDELSRYRLLLEITRDGIVVMNADGSVREANRKFASMIGYPAEELPNLHVWDWDHSIAREDLDKMLAEVDERGEQFETRHVRRDGTEYDVEICGSGISYGGEKLIICICRDISGQKKAREALRQSEEKFRTLVENSTDAIARFDRQCRHLYVNPQTEKVTGLPKEAFIGKSSAEMGAPEELCRFFRENIEAVFSSGRRIETELQSPGGLCIEWVFMPERDGSGNVITVISSSRDVTERKRGEEEREKLIRELQEALAEIKALRGIIPICSFCKKIRDDSGYWEQVDTYLQRHKYADVSHSVCPECVRKYYPEIKDKI
jgi:PAS domain S-box-containing protein